MAAGEKQEHKEGGDEHFVETVMQQGLMSESQIDACRRTQERLLKEGQHRTLAEIATQKTLISQTQADGVEKDALPSHVPKKAGNYEILRQIGEGGMGTVYKARHVKLGSFAAVKFLPAHLARDANFVQRFEREARLAAQLSSPYSVRTFDVGEVEGMHHILMEYVEGESLDELLTREGQMEEKRALRVTRDVATALEEAHETGIIHRDIKPGNILLTRRGAPKLADLGLAKSVEAEQVSLTSVGAILGTPSYMSPEQAMGLPDLDARTDIFSLGATLYRMVVGDLPFKGETPVNVMHKIATEPLSTPLTRNPALSRDTAAIICKMMAKERKDRYHSMAEVTRDIETILSGEKTGLKYEETVALVNPAARAGRQPSRPRARRKLMLAIGVGAVVVAVGVGLFMAQQYGLFKTAPRQPVKPLVTAGALLTRAHQAAKNKSWEQARSLSKRVVDEFPNAPELAQAAALLDTATRELTLQSLLHLAVEGDVLVAAGKLKEAEEKWPNEKRIGEIRRTMDARLEKAYNGVMKKAAAAEAKEDFAGAITAYQEALQFRDTQDAKKKLKLAQLRGQLKQAGTVKDVGQKLSAVAAAFQKDGDASTQQTEAKIKELIGARGKALAALENARKFQEKMPPAIAAAFRLTEQKWTRAEKKLEALQPLAMAAETLDRVTTDLLEAETRFGKAASDAFDALFPGIDKELEGPGFAAGLARLCPVKEHYGDYPRMKQLLAKHDPGGSAMAIVGLVAGTKIKASDYPSSKEAGDLCKKLDEAWRRCQEYKAPATAEKKATSLKVLVLSRRAAARDAAGTPLAALADAAVAATLAGSDQKFLELLSPAVAHAIEDLGRALKAGKAHDFVEKVGDLLGGKEHARARELLGAAIRKVPFMREFMRDAALVGAWSKTVAPFEPPGMVAVPAGVFSLGLKYEGLVTLAPSSSPEHPVKLGKFCIDVHEVTNEEFQQFVDDGAYADDRWWAEAKGVDRKAFTDATAKPGPRLWSAGRFLKGEEKLPVVGVSLYEAAAYARWTGKRLPTEAEWECAALGIPPKDGAETFGKQPFPWGESYVQGNANLGEAKVGKPEAVGARQKDKSASGCFGMVGNVREWTSSAYDPYPGTKCQDKNFKKGMLSVRGSSFADSFIGAAPTVRRAVDKATRDAQIGFRCAWAPAGKPDGP